MPDKTPDRIIERIASDIGAASTQVNSAIELLDGGATVPFISRYRKEATGGLTDTQLRKLDERLSYLRELDTRRQSIIAAIEEQGKLDDRLRGRLNAVESKAELEDLYLPFRKKRRTKGQIAIEAGLEPLADSLWQNPQLDPAGEAKAFVAAEQGVVDLDAALDGARFILMERFAEDAELIARLRTLLIEGSYLCSKVQAAKAADGAKFSDYFDHQERYARVPGHRAMAMFRGRADGVLGLSLLLPERQPDGSAGYGDADCLAAVAAHLSFSHRDRPADDWRRQVLRSTWRIKLSMHLETELFSALRARADAEAIAVFSANLRDLLLAAPAGPRAVLGLDPGFRSGVKVVVVDSGGQVVDHCAIFPHQPQNQWAQSLQKLRDLCLRHSVELVAIGNGTASRETDRLAAELAAMKGLEGLTRIVVSEAGASVYSASLTAEQEFPDLDVTIRGAISIARRLQDPLAELVKIDPKAIGVGQYQHDVAQGELGRSLDATVEDCVSAVGVDLQTASATLLARVAGLSTALAENIVAWRNENGAFRTRRELKKVPRLGPKAFEQAAGFLRIRQGDDPLDASGVHPEAYPVVKRIIARTGRSLSELIGDTAVLRALDPASLVDEQFGLPTVKDILAELEKPGRDPRPEFRMVRFAEGVEKLSDLKPGQILEGQVTNVTAFGAFVDVGVHQDGLVHISALSDQFVKDPREVVKAGDIVKVKVMDVDAQRKRIGLSMRLSDEPGAQSRERGNEKPRGQSRGSSSTRTEATQPQPSALALSLSAALTKKPGTR